MPDPYEEIVAALQAGPTPGPWIADSQAETIHGYTAEGEARVIVYELGTNEADHRLIAACSPEVIRSLVADAKRYAFIRSVGHEQLNVLAHYAGDALDAAIDAALLRKEG